jgi:hypothetical protein
VHPATPAGNLYLLGGITGSADLGGGAVLSKGEQDLFLASYRPDRTLRWARTFGERGRTPVATDLVVDDAGVVTITGIAQAGVDLGAGPIPSGPAFVTSAGFIAQ